jgi:hypothetical protein
MTWRRKKYIRCGRENLVSQFVNSDEYLAFECIGYEIAWRVMPTGETEIITGYNGPEIDDFDLAKGVLIISQEEPVE